MCVRTDTHTPCAAPSEAIDRLTALWLSLLVAGTKRFREQQAAEFPAFAADLLNAGFSEEALAASMREKGRKLNEWPRQWAERLRQQRQPAAAAEESPAERKARQDRERQEEAARLNSPEEQARLREQLDKLRKKVGRKP